jgi:predicted  nucleic acid-binding Zn-ribbon protein
MPHQCTNCGRAFEDGSKEMLSGCPDCGGNKFQFMPADAMDGSDVDAGGRNTATAPKKSPEDAPTGDAPGAGGTRGERPAGRESSPSETKPDSRSSAVNRAAATVREWVGRRDDSDRQNAGDVSAESSPTTSEADSTATESASTATESDSTATDPDPTAAESTSEDSAQASARADVVNESELPDDVPEAGLSTEDASRPADDSQTPPETSDDGNVVSPPDEEEPGLEELREELNSQFESIRIVEPGQYELNLMELYEREEYIISLQEDGKYVIEVPDAWDAAEQ